MSKSDVLDAIVQSNNGFLKTAEATAAGVSRSYLGEYAKRRGLRRVAHGLYMSEGAWPDGMFVLQFRFPNAVFSHETALYLLGLAAREPLNYSVTIASGASATGLIRSGVKVYKIKETLHPLGITELVTPAGHEVKAYGAERTICDLIRSRNNVEMQDYQSAIRGYTRMKNKDLNLLMHYAREFRVEKTLMRYLEVLLP